MRVFNDDPCRLDTGDSGRISYIYPRAVILVDSDPGYGVLPAGQYGHGGNAAGFSAAENKLLVNFYWADNSSYICMYQGTGAGGETMDYIDLVYFDRSFVVQIKYILPDAHYAKLEAAVLATVESVSWARPDPIPDGLSLYYSEFGDFEFGTPRRLDIRHSRRRVLRVGPGNGSDADGHGGGKLDHL